MSERSYPEDLESVPCPTFEESDLTRPEYIAALVHFYRGEMHRATLWRMRLDNTTNWAIISVMGLVTFSLGDPKHSHVGILVGMVLVLTFMAIEARRYRFFDVWRSRARMLEENFMGPILRRDLQSPIQGWGQLVADDLLKPSFKINWNQALRARLLRNYVPLFGLLLVCWVLKLAALTPADKDSTNPLLDHMQIGNLPWWVAAGFVLCLYGYLFAIALFAGGSVRPEVAYWGDSSFHETVDEEKI